MKNTKRAWRRHHRQRMIARALRSCKLSGFEFETWEEKWDWAKREHNHLQMCSCWMCGHRRRTYGPTIQERRQNQRERENYTIE